MDLVLAPGLTLYFRYSYRINSKMYPVSLLLLLDQRLHHQLPRLRILGGALHGASEKTYDLAKVYDEGGIRTCDLQC